MRKVSPKGGRIKRSDIIRKADKTFSLYVRQKYSNEEGTTECFTCGYKAHWKRLQNGHYITRALYYTRWDERNCRPQCFVCNMRRQGMSHVFREKLVNEYGEQSIKQMELMAKRRFDEDDEWLIEKLKEVDSLLSQLSTVSQGNL